ncbi:MAG: VWA domain-containing protein [Vicinamibacteria bacterium]|nr:VWA domain-containing protein [Vicinamibacteria bacterium]
MAATFSLAVLGGAVAGQAQAQERALEVFRAGVDNVYVDASVSNRGDPVVGLSASAFELKDNGVVQSFELVSAESLPLLAVLAFDTSNSLVGEKLLALRTASRAFLESLRPQDEVAVFAFSGEIQWLARPTTDKAAIRREIDQLQPAGATSVIDALYAALTLPKTQSRTLVVLFTDGEDNMSFLDWGQLRQVAERSNALIHVVGLRRDDDGFAVPSLDLGGRMLPSAGTLSLEFEHTWALRQIAATTGGRYWEAESPARLKTAFAAIAETMGYRYVLRYEPQNVKRPGWHRIELRLVGQKGDVHTRNGYWVGER